MKKKFLEVSVLNLVQIGLWFLGLLNDERILRAEKSLCEYLRTDNLTGKRFLDAGSGLVLFSLTARSLGAEVHSLSSVIAKKNSTFSELGINL